jgi:hypothetical protein
VQNNCRRSWRTKYLSLASIGSLAAFLMAGGINGGRADSTRDEAGTRSESAFCQVSARAGCQCSFATMETPFTFSEAAGIILTLYLNFPDERYSRLLEDFLHQCAGELVPAARPQTTKVISGDPGARPHARIQAPPTAKGVLP